jgi:aryl-alcohol dehydrogenase-like predicted oxidoreductase
VSLLPWGPLCGGALSGKYLPQTATLQDDTTDAELARARFTLFPDRYPRYNSPKVHAAVEKYVKIAHEVGLTPSQLAIAFCNSRWFVGSTLVGATSNDQLEENLEAFSMSLPEDVLSAVDNVHTKHRNPTLID